MGTIVSRIVDDGIVGDAELAICDISETDQLVLGSRGKLSPSAVHCEDLEVLKDVVLRSDTVMFSPLCLMERELREGSIVVLPCEEAWLKTNYGIVRLKGRNLPLVAEHFMEKAKEVDQQCLQQGAELKEGFMTQSSRRKRRQTKSIKGTSVRK